MPVQGRVDDFLVAGRCFARRIGEVTKHREVNVLVLIAEVSNFQLLDHFIDRGHVGKITGTTTIVRASAGMPLDKSIFGSRRGGRCA